MINWEQIANQLFQKEFEDYKKKTAAGRRPDTVEFTTIDQDVKRRDLTINALFYDIDTNEIVDLVGGIEDLKNGVVRTVGRAADRFGEDRLRILRAIRFAGRFGSELDTAVDAALQKDASLEKISGERIRDEFLKGVPSSKSTVHFLRLLDRYNLLDWIFKGMQYSKSFIEEKDPIVLLAHLLQPTATLGGAVAIQRGLNELKYSVNEIKAISFLSLLRQLKPETAVKLKKIQQNAGVSDEQIRKIADIERLNQKLVNAFIKFQLTITGQELMDQGFSGKALGAEMEKRETENFLKLL